MMTRTTLTLWICAVVLLNRGGALGLQQAASAEPASAAQILAATGVQGGLVSLGSVMKP